MAVLIDPPAPPLPGPGLLSAAVGPLPLPVHAQADGLQYQLDSCGDVRLWPLDCEGDPPAKEFDPGPDVLASEAFMVYASLVCGAAGTTLEEAEGRVRRRLQLKEQYGVERAFWGGTTDVPGYLQSNTVETLPAQALPVDALSRLEQALADNYGLPGLIHVRPETATWLGHEGIVRWDASSQTLKTWAGNTVVVGSGYGNAGPDGTTPAAGAWMYATGRTIVWRDEVFVPRLRETFNQKTNEVYALAERAYALAVECYIGAINVGAGA